MKKEITLPQRIEVENYHDFATAQEYFKLLNKKIKVKEIGFDGNHVGIVYVCSLQEPENKFLFNKIKKECKTWDQENYEQ